MSDQNLTGRVVVHGNWAQYVLAIMGAHSPGNAGLAVAFDGPVRTCYPAIDFAWPAAPEVRRENTLLYTSIRDKIRDKIGSKARYAP